MHAPDTDNSAIGNRVHMRANHSYRATKTAKTPTRKKDRAQKHAKRDGKKEQKQERQRARRHMHVKKNACLRALPSRTGPGRDLTTAAKRRWPSFFGAAPNEFRRRRSMRTAKTSPDSTLRGKKRSRATRHSQSREDNQLKGLRCKKALSKPACASA